MNTTAKSIFETQVAVSGLNKVAGFDPRKFMRKTISELTKQEIIYLDLKYKKLWFRLAYPKGRIKKTALKITEQIAIIEAKVYFDKDDAEPVASFIAQRNADGKLGSLYIEAAQYAAENQALNDAGFGLQFCDISQGNDAEQLDSGVPVSIAAAKDAAVPTTDETQITQSVVEAPSVQAHETGKAVKNAIATEQASAIMDAVTDSVAEETQTQEEIQAQPADEKVPSEQQAEVIMAATAVAGDEKESQPNNETPAQPIESYSAVTDYTANMAVDEILALMTPEHAAAVVVDTGTCKDWTLAKVAAERPASLKWYLNGYTGANNILRAGAKLLLDGLLEKKAA